MIQLKRRNDEDINEFVNRIVTTVESSNDEVEADFLDGIVINTKDFIDKENLYISLANAINNNYNGDGMSKLGYGDQNVNSSGWSPLRKKTQVNIPEDIFNSQRNISFEPLISPKKEEVITEVDTLDNDPTFEPLISDSDNLELDSTEDQQTFDKKFWEPLIYKEAVQERIEVNKSLSEEIPKKEMLTALESLDMLTSYAISANGLDGITVEEYQNIDKAIVEAKNFYNNLLRIKKEEKIDKIAKCNAYMESANNIIKEQNAKYDKMIASYQSDKEEYEKLIAEYNYINEQFDKACNNFKQKMGDKEFKENLTLIDEVSKFVDKGFPKNEAFILLSKYENKIQLMDKVVDFRKENPEDEITTISAIEMMTTPNSSKELLNSLEEICKLNSDLQAYEEYINTIYSANYLEEINEKIAELESEKQTDEDIKKSHDEYTLSILEGSFIDENGKISHDLERDDPQLLIQKQKIELLNNAANISKYRGNHPIIISTEIKKLLDNGASKELISEKIDSLLQFVNVNTIENTFTNDQEKITNIERRIEELTIERDEREYVYDGLKQDHDNELYKNDIIYISDLRRLQKYVNKGRKLDQDIERVTAIYNRKDNLKQLGMINLAIITQERDKNKAENKKITYLEANKENIDQEKLDKINRTIERCDRVITKYRQQRIRLIHEIYKAKGFASKEKLNELNNEKARVNKKIEQIINEINDKKQNYGYIDQELKLSLEESIANLNAELNLLKNLKSTMTNHTIEKLKDNILNYNVKEIENNISVKHEDIIENEKDSINKDDKFIEDSEDDLQEVESYKETPKGIIAKIKSIDFKKLANFAIKKIALAAATVAVGASTIIGAHLLKNKDASVELSKVSKLNNLENITQEITNQKNEDIKSEINELVNNEESSVKIDVANEEKAPVVVESKNFVDTSKISTNLDKSANRQFIDQDNINESSFQNENIKRFEYIEKDGQLIRKIYGKDGTPQGTPIGYENVTQEEVVEGKTR